MSRTAVSSMLAGCVGILLALPPAWAEGLDEVVVTATRAPQSLAEVPATISVVSGQELSARDSRDLSASLALVSGVEAPSGGDAGPSSAVPSFWGLHEFDAFLLVVDGVPWGGAFNPAITTLNLTGVQRIEVLKGAAPVMYGATSFVGVVQAIHYPAGAADDAADVAYGSYGSLRGSVSAALPSTSSFRESLFVDGGDTNFSDPREKARDANALYRGSLDLGSGVVRLDANLSFVRDVPPSPVLHTGPGMSAVTPVDANFNPADARIDENKYHLALGYTQPAGRGQWETLLSFAYSTVTDIRAFLHPDLSGTADTQSQSRAIDDGYFDTHWIQTTSDGPTLAVGADLLYGRGRQTSLNGNDGYTVPLDGSALPPPSYDVPVTEIGTIDDRRLFAGQFAQATWKLGSRWNVDAGIRLNETYEQKESSDLTLPPPDFASATVHKTIVKPSETLGISYRAWTDGNNQAVLYADFRNAFKPAAVDFGPDYTPDLLSPETAQSYEIGLKGALADGRLTYQTELFALNFSNLVVPTSSGALANAGGEKLRGVEVEARLRATEDLSFVATASYHDATFSNYLFFDGESDVNVSGRQLPLSPHVMAAAGLLYTPVRGFISTAVFRYVGRRYLDEENTAEVGGYGTIDANIGYRWDRYDLRAEGANLTDRRPPVTASEFGSESFYLLSGRTLWLRIGYSWK
ncbi:MAG: TonB-dependent receptor [Proteobacteria bacterium]|nr:TonB-dependent receptor [Pseudomonadota bacterium]